MKSQRNKTIKISNNEKIQEDLNIICGNLFDKIPLVKDESVDLLISDPPYNIDKKFNSLNFKKMSITSYKEYTEEWIKIILPKLKSNASIYVFGDWRSSSALYEVLDKYFIVKNRITFEREKGRGANSNWKNCSEDIWFCTRTDKYVFNINEVKLRKKVIAPYKENGIAKDWKDNGDFKYRDTHPSNVWSDITIPFWSMCENTEHPTQKPEKLIAKIILASSIENDIVFDPFLGSGTTAVVSKKLDRGYVGIEIDSNYCQLARKRLILKMANTNKVIQGNCIQIKSQNNKFFVLLCVDIETLISNVWSRIFRDGCF